MSGATLIDVLPAHQFDEAKLANYLQDYLPGANQGIKVQQFQEDDDQQHQRRRLHQPFEKRRQRQRQHY